MAMVAADLRIRKEVVVMGAVRGGAKGGVGVCWTWCWSGLFAWSLELEPCALLPPPVRVEGVEAVPWRSP